MRTCILLCCAFLLLAVAGTPARAAAMPVLTKTIRLSVENVRNATGTIWVGIYEGEHDFLDREKARLVYVKVDATGRATIDLPEMIVGKTYALGLFHDLNDNGDLDLNWLGLPSEPWAFTGEPKTRLRLPYFDEVSFRVNPTLQSASVRLRMF